MRTILLAAAAALALTGCTRGDSYETTAITQGYRVNPCASCAYIYVSVWTDPETGCESYVTDDGFMSPRLSVDGTQRCPTALRPVFQEQVVGQ